ncbi:MAG TPA: AfsA-related hotdog domain-containing protein [Pseudonocardiaceae bacterium]
MTTRNTSLPPGSDVPQVSAPDVPSLSAVADGNGDNSRHFVVIADRFAPFADGERVLTMSGLLVQVALESLDDPGQPWTIHVGQGIDHSDWRILESACHVRGTPIERVGGRAFSGGPQVSPDVVHKQRPENVLLSDIRHLSRGYCAADLCIHRNNELVMDHCTGEHVQGMVILEAMRQICIAQFETGYRPELPAFEYSGVWKRIDLSFQDFLFALPATVTAEVTFQDLSRLTNLKFGAHASVCQNGNVVASAEIEYAMIKHERLASMEHARATRASRNYLEGFAG